MSHEVAFQPSQMRPPWPDRARALVALGVARLLLRFMSVERIARLLDMLRRRVARRPATAEEAAHAADVIRASSLACAAGWNTRRCSIAVALFCITERRWVEWCLGMRRSPLQSRAWVQVDSRPIDDRIDVDGFVPVVAAGPHGVSVGP